MAGVEVDKEIADNVSRLRDALPEVTALLVAILNESGTRKLTPAQVTARGLLDRGACWLTTLHDLNKAQHYQAHAAGVRAMIELTVDFALLYEDQTQNERIEAWEMSAKLRHAQLSVEYHRRRGSPVIEQPRMQVAAQFFAEKRDEVERSRKRWWGGQHPERWTRRTLVEDVRIVEDKYPGANLREVYEFQYRIMCWTLHGSTLAMTRNTRVDTVVSIMGMALYGAATLAFAAAEFAARVLDVFDSGWQVKLQHAHEDWSLRYGGFKLIR